MKLLEAISEINHPKMDGQEEVRNGEAVSRKTMNSLRLTRGLDLGEICIR